MATHEDGTAEVEVVYGTTKLKLATRLFDLTISKTSEMDACGLYRATRFDLDNTVWLPWDTDWFEIRADLFSPVIGKLTAEAIKLLQLIVSYKQMAASPASAAEAEEDKQTDC